jgi:hypothetical protein
MGIFSSKPEKIFRSTSPRSFWDLKSATIDGDAFDFASLRKPENKAFLIVNVARW